jgi:hypothetical protein
MQVNALAIVHKRTENSQVGILFVHKWLRKRHTPFLGVVEDQEIYNFPINHLVHFCFEILSKQQSNRANEFKPGQPRPRARRCARRRGTPTHPHYVHMPRSPSDRQSVRGALLTVLQVLLTRSRALGRCHTFRPQTLAGGVASRHCASVPPHVAAPCPMLCHAETCFALAAWRARIPFPHGALAYLIRASFRSCESRHAPPSAIDPPW